LKAGEGSAGKARKTDSWSSPTNRPAQTRIKKHGQPLTDLAGRVEVEIKVCHASNGNEMLELTNAVI
jgi:hypothetical protein